MHQRCKYIVTTAERTEAVRELVDGTEIDRIASYVVLVDSID